MNTLTKVILINVAAVVALLFLYPEFMISPGVLKKGHRDITDCFACHTPFSGATANKCVTCHTVDRIGILTTKGEPVATRSSKVAFHQKLLEEDCVGCHSDHRGVEIYRTVRRFSHGLLQPSIQKECETCHQSPVDTLHRNVAGQCQQCHALERWVPATFDHEPYFRFDRHHETACATCHENSDYSRYTCYGCHEHSPWKIRSEHLEEGIRDFKECVECHRSGDEEEAEWRWRSLHGSGWKERRGEGHHEHDDDDD